MKYRRTLATAKRLNEILGMLIRYGFEELVDQEGAKSARRWLAETFGSKVPEFDSKSLPERARLLLQELGPTFVKFGQMAASQSSSLPEEWVHELSLLQSNVPPVGTEDVVAVITEELGAHPEEVFGSFEMEALAAASIGQVHRATLPDGTPVAVKVQRPNITDKIEEDLTIMYDTAGMLESTSQIARDFGAVSVVNEFATSLMEELSYRHEGRNTVRLGKNIQSYPHIRTADIHWEFSSNRVLTMEFITGVKPTEHDAWKEAGVDGVELSKELAQCMSQQLLVDGFFHADPHPGNISINLESKEMIFLDTGMMGILDKAERRDLVQLMLAIYQRDAPALAKIVTHLSDRQVEMELRALSHELERMLGGMLDPPLSEVGAGRFFATLLEILREHGVRLPSSMVMALKSLMQMLEVVVALNPTLTFSDVSEIVAHSLMEHQAQPDNIKHFLQDRVRRVQLLGPMVDDALEALLRQAQRGAVKVELRGLDLSKEVQTVATIARHLTLAIVLGGATVGSAIAMGTSPSGFWRFIPMVGAVGFVISLLLSIWLLFQDIRKR